jgi:serine phosphatase RsbU (regulator of sigma subunit)
VVEDTGAVRFSLRWKIVGGFALLLMLIIVLGWVTLSLFNSTRRVQSRVFERAIPELVALEGIVGAYTAQSAAVRGYVISPGQALLEQYRREYQVATGLQERALELEPAGPELDLLEELIEAGEEFDMVVENRVVPLASEGQRTQAFRILGEEGNPLIERIEVLGNALLDTQSEIVEQTEADIASNTNRALLILILVIAAATLVALVTAILLPRRLVRSIDTLVQAARGIERGHFDQKIEIHSGDEIEELADRFEQMQAGLKRLQQLALQDRELEIAAQIQRNLLMRRVPEFEGAKLHPVQRQTSRVGGDWYDLAVHEQTVTAVIGDASGKGIGAALMATVTLSALRAERGRGAAPKHIVASVNRALLDATDPDSFTTAIYLTLNIDTGEARWLNMGHSPPFLLRAGDDDEAGGDYVEGPRNRVLGWFDEPGLAVSDALLEPGDRLVLVTDGILEAKGPEGELFGEGRLAETLVRLAPLDLEELGEELVAEVERFTAGKLDDDLTMLLIEYSGVEKEAPAE